MQYRTFGQEGRLGDLSVTHSMGQALYSWFNANLRPSYRQQFKARSQIGTVQTGTPVVMGSVCLCVSV